MRVRRFAALLVGLGAASEAQAEGSNVAVAPQKPLWELGLGASTLYGPVYPGASEQKWNGIAAPLVIYRGKRLRAGDYAVVRTIAADNGRVQLDLSLDAAYSASDSVARRGMPDLEYLFQIGPQAIVRLYDSGWSPEGRSEIKLIVPVRGVASTDFQSIRHAGWLAEPAMMYRRQYPGDRGLAWSATLFASFADDNLMDEWYGVAPQYARPDRPAYQAKGGYLSTGLKISATRKFSDNFQAYLTWQGRSFEGAANEKASLLQEKSTSAVSISFTWRLAKSVRSVAAD